MHFSLYWRIHRQTGSIEILEYIGLAPLDSLRFARTSDTERHFWWTTEDLS
jgi:hypothetical protein